MTGSLTADNGDESRIDEDFKFVGSCYKKSPRWDLSIKYQHCIELWDILVKYVTFSTVIVFHLLHFL